MGRFNYRKANIYNYSEEISNKISNEHQHAVAFVDDTKIQSPRVAFRRWVKLEVRESVMIKNKQQEPF